MIEQIPIDKIKPSPFQPRLTFELEELRGSIIKHGIIDPLKVRKVGDHYELVDGERRFRIAKEEGFKTVLCIIVGYNDEEADSLSWKLNTERKEYTFEEKAKHFRWHQKHDGLSDNAIANRHGYSQYTVSSYLSIFRLPEKYQNLIWSGEFQFKSFQYLYTKGLLNGNSALSEITKLIDQAVDRNLPVEDFIEVIDDYILKLKEKQVEVAKKAAATIEAHRSRVGKAKGEAPTPKIIEPKTSEDYEQAAKVLKNKAKELETPEQKRLKVVKKAEDYANDLDKYIDKNKVFIDFNKWLSKAKQINIQKDPQTALEKLKAIKKDVVAEKMAEEKRIKEEKKRKLEQEKKRKEKEQQKKREDAIRKKAEEETKQKLLHDKDFVDKILASTPKTISAIPEAVIQTLSKEQRDQVVKAFTESEAELAKRKGNPVLIQRGNLVKNWMAHTEVAGLAKSLACPICNADFGNLVWKCHNLSVGKAQTMLKAKLEEK